MDKYIKSAIDLPVEFCTSRKPLEPLLDKAGAIYVLATKFFESLNDQRSGTGFNGPEELAPYAIVARSLKTYSAILGLCHLGCGADAIGLSGTLFESRLDLLYMCQDLPRRSQQWVEFETVAKILRLRKRRSRNGIPSDQAAEVDRLLSEFSAADHALADQYPKEDWAKSSIFDRAKALGVATEYDTSYWDVCQMKHATPASASRTTGSFNGLVDVIKGPNIGGLWTALEYSTIWFIPQLISFDEVFHIGMNSALDENWKAFENEAKRLAVSNPELKS